MSVRYWVALLSLGTLVMAGQSQAQAGEDADFVWPKELPAIVVTAQKVEQDVLEVPASVAVVDAQTLALHQIDSLQDLGRLVDGLSISSYTGGQPRIYLRGMGDAFDLKNKRIAVYVDGVPQLDSTLQDPMLLDTVERIEVLKGPQGTLYGRNAAAGVINIVSRRPEGDTVTASVGAGNQGQRRGSVGLSRQLVQGRVRLGVNASWLKHDGVLENVATGSRGQLDGQTRRNLHVKADFVPSERTTVNLGLHHFEDDSAPYLQTFIDPQTLTPIRRDSGFGFVPVRFHQVDRDTEGYTKTRGSSVTLKFSHDFGAFQLNAISGWQQDRLRTVTDVDFSSNPLFKWDFAPYINDHRQLSQELQLVGGTGRLHWQSGVFAYREQTGNSNVFKTSFGDILSRSRYRTSGYAWYGQVNYALATHWTASVGGRFQRDRQRLSDLQQGGRQSRGAESSASARAALSYAVAPGHASFLSYSTGYTPGGVNTSPQMVDGLPIGPYLAYRAENINSLEWGIKGRWPDQRLAYALSLYQSKLRNQQMLDPADTQMKNLGASRYRGVETSLDWQFSRLWSVHASHALNESSVRKSHDPAELGKSVPFAPRNSGRLGVQFRHALADAMLTVRLDMHHIGRIEADSYNSFGQSGHRTASLNAQADFRRWWLRLGIANVSDKRHYSNVIANSPFPGTHTALYAPPRTLLLTLGGRF